MQQLSHLLASAEFPVKLKEEAKEAFFATRKNQRRMKTSFCLSEPVDKGWSGEMNLDLSVNSLRSNDTGRG